MTDYTGTLNAGDRFRFQSATVTARKIKIEKQPIPNKKKHRAQRAKCQSDGFIYVDKPWKEVREE